MKKIVSILMILGMLIGLCACASKDYENAKKDLNSKNYNAAIPILEALAAKDYEDSANLLLDAKYLYVKDNYDRDNARSVTYLETLKEKNYKDSQKLYDDLFSWKADIAISTRRQSGIHYDELNVTSQTFPIYYFNFRTYDGPPEGEFHGKYEIVFSNGKKITDTFIGKDNSFYFAITLSATANPRGKTEFNVYGENGKLLATKTSIIR